MSSFYGGGGVSSGGITPGEVNAKILEAEELMRNHIYFSRVQPNIQKAGDVWMVLTEFPDSVSALVQELQNKRQGN